MTLEPLALKTTLLFPDLGGHSLRAADFRVELPGEQGPEPPEDPSGGPGPQGRGEAGQGAAAAVRQGRGEAGQPGGAVRPGRYGGGQ